MLEEEDVGLESPDPFPLLTFLAAGKREGKIDGEEELKSYAN